jgi:hypothetical protein
MEETRLGTMKLARQGAVLLVLFSTLVCGGAFYGLWRLTKLLSLGEMQAWAIVATLALPVVAFIAFLFGRREASVMADGMRAGVNEVTRTADEITTFKDKAASRSRQPPVTVQVAAAALPAPQIYHKQLEGETERVDL